MAVRQAYGATVQRTFVLPALEAATGQSEVTRATARVRTHKGEYLQGPVPLGPGPDSDYTIGVFSLLDDLNSAYVDVRLRDDPSAPPVGTSSPASITVQPNGWNDGEVLLVRAAVTETWRFLKQSVSCSYEVFGYHDIKVGAGSGSSSALVQAAILATAAEHGVRLVESEILEIHGKVESGADPLTQKLPVIVTTRRREPVVFLGEEMPDFRAVTWSAGPAVRTSEVNFDYKDEEFLMWRVRWASLGRAVRTGDAPRVARLAMKSASENQRFNPNADFGLLETAVERFGALGFAVAHTGTYHTALFAADTGNDVIEGYKHFVRSSTSDTSAPVKPENFSTRAAARTRYET